MKDVQSGGLVRKFVEDEEMRSKAVKVLYFVAAIVFVAAFSVSANGTKEKSSAASTSAKASKALPVVGIATGSSGTEWRDEMISSLKMVGNEYVKAGKIASFRLVNNVTNGDATEQANIIRNFISQGANIILFDPNSATALNGVLKQAQAAGILVVSFDGTVTAPKVLNVTLDHYAWEYKWANWICKTLQQGNVIQIYGLPGQPANTARVKASQDVLKQYPNIHLIAQTTGYWDETRAKEAATQIIATGKQIDGVFTQDGMAYGVLQAFLDAGKLPKVMFADPSVQFFKQWRKLHNEGKNIQFVTEANPPGIGGTAFRMALELYNGKQWKPGILKNDVYYEKSKVFVTQANFEQVWNEDLKGHPDAYLLNYVESQKAVDALFQQ